jgi:hypothetical protein
LLKLYFGYPYGEVICGCNANFAFHEFIYQHNIYYQYSVYLLRIHCYRAAGQLLRK